MADTKTTKPRGDEATSGGWSEAERAAMKERHEELKKARGKKGGGEADVLAKIAEMPEPDRTMAERIHSIIREAAPELMPRTWYGMPAYAKDGKVLCFFTAASKFDERYASFGFNAVANLDEGTMWPTQYAITRLTKADEKRIADLVRRAVS